MEFGKGELGKTRSTGWLLLIVISIWNKIWYNLKQKNFKSPPTELWKSFQLNWKEHLVRIQWMHFSISPQVWILCHCQTLWNLTLSQEKRSGYALYPSIASTWTTPWPKLEPQCLFNFSTHSREAWKHDTRHKGTFQLCQSLVNGLYPILSVLRNKAENIKNSLNIW